MDPFKTLGINPGASEDDIKKAFRNMAKKYHPDTNPNDPTLERKFKEINEAYQLALSTSSNDDDDGFNFGRATDFRFVFRFSTTIYVNLTLEEAYHGVTKSMVLDSSRSIPITFPPGSFQSSSVSRVIGNTQYICVIKILPHKKFRMINNLDMETQERVNFLTLFGGGTISVDTISGVTTDLIIKEKTKAGTVCRIPGMGFRSGITVGDLYVTLEGQIPTNDKEILDFCKNRIH